MNWRAIWAIMRKDLRVVLQNKGVVLPIILVPVILFVVLPLLVLLLPQPNSFMTRHYCLKEVWMIRINL